MKVVEGTIVGGPAGPMPRVPGPPWYLRVEAEPRAHLLPWRAVPSLMECRWR